MRKVLFWVVTALSMFPRAYSQDSTFTRLNSISGKYLDQIQRKSEKWNTAIDRGTARFLSRLQKHERKLKQKLARVDSVAAAQIFDSPSANTVAHFRSALQSKSKQYRQVLSGRYDGYLDTLTNSLGFLKDSKQWLNNSSQIKGRLEGTLQSVNAFQEQAQYVEQVKAFIKKRRQLLNDQLSQYAGFSKQLKKLSKDAHYYSERMKSYKEAFKDPRKAEQEVLAVLRKTKAFNNFMSRNSQLASLFTPAGSNSAEDLAQSLEGLQTRTMVENLIQQQMGGAAGNASSTVSEQMEMARSQFEQLKKNFPDADNAAEMPDFKPNDMKRKRFVNRLEFGGNVQFQKGTHQFPAGCDLSLQVGYKFHKSGVIGAGMVYKVGLGEGWNKIRLSHQGIGIRSFADWKVTRTLYVNGGYEKHYNAAFSNPLNLRGADGWSTSGLIGISTKVKIPKSRFKSNAMLLYDFLAEKQYPATFPLKVRLGTVL